MKAKGVISCGHPQTAHAAAQILEEGGNAFDAVIAAHFAACVAEPVLASLGGGGFLNALPADKNPMIFDFFCQTPMHKLPLSEIDLYPITADFGESTQEFHIGMGSIAVPGSVKGMFEIHKQLCSLPMSVLLQPAIQMAKEGVVVNEFQAYIFDIVKPIYLSNPSCVRLYGSRQQSANEIDLLVQPQELLRQPDLADTFAALAEYGEAYFYQNDIARSITQACHENGGFLNENDLHAYEVVMRKPVELKYKNYQIFMNPPPSSGGLLISFALKILENLDISQYRKHSIDYLKVLIDVMQLTNKVRVETNTNAALKDTLHLLEPDVIREYTRNLTHNYQFNRGTTHISIIDQLNNVASMTVSNGEGSGFVVPATGIVLNNMLGEQDINPAGFNQWQENQRISSMMSPTVMAGKNSELLTLGSGGSNRIRSAILQVIINLIDHGENLIQAVEAPRIHFENNFLNVESGIENYPVSNFGSSVEDIKYWNNKNLYFGGAHCVAKHENNFEGAGDPRRGGISVIV